MFGKLWRRNWLKPLNGSECFLYKANRIGLALAFCIFINLSLKYRLFHISIILITFLSCKILSIFLLFCAFIHSTADIPFPVFMSFKNFIPLYLYFSYMIASFLLFLFVWDRMSLTTLWFLFWPSPDIEPLLGTTLIHKIISSSHVSSHICVLIFKGLSDLLRSV